MKTAKENKKRAKLSKEIVEKKKEHLLPANAEILKERLCIK